MNFPYEDIVNRMHHRSKKRAPMPLYDRAAQFSPFAALTGYEDVIRETGRYTDEKRELGEDEKERLDQALIFLYENRESTVGTFTCFMPDPTKEGGSYQRFRGRIRKLNPLRHEVELTDGQILQIGDIMEISWTKNPADI